jgi:3-hydroxymyristoyl/3-hydroxydecanoyl-(acyl carrier protein) dehydratase
MSLPWSPALIVAPDGPDFYRAEWLVEPESPWFDGHFPQRRILPGLGMLALVVQVTRQALGLEGLRLERVLKARFKGLVVPGQRLHVAVSLADPSTDGSRRVRFELQRGAESIGQGTLEVCPGD